MAICNINGTDFSGNIEVGSYSINASDVYSSWTDANGINHRQIIRQQVTGKFTMGFRNMDEYNSFVQAVRTNRNVEGWIPCYLFVNNLNTNRSCKMYVSYSPTLGKNGTRNYIEMFEVQMQER